MTIVLNDNMFAEILKGCHDELIRNGYSVGEYAQESDVRKIFDISFKYYLHEFETEVRKIENASDLFFFMELYECKEADQEYLIFKNVCRYVISMIPSLKLKSEAQTVLSNDYISKLFFLAHQIGIISQAIAQQYIFEGNLFHFNITEADYEFAIQQTKVVNILEHCKLAISSGSRKSYCDTTQLLEQFITIIRSDFNPESDELWDKIYPSNHYIGDLEDMSFGEFNAIMNNDSGNQPPKGVVEVSDIVSKYMDSDFVNNFLLKDDNVNLENAIVYPQKTDYRSRYKPIIQFNIDNTCRYFTTGDIFYEALSEVCNSQFFYNVLPPNWDKKEKIVHMASKCFDIHSKLLEKAIVDMIPDCDRFKPFSNKKKINGINLATNQAAIYINKYQMTINAGEIDSMVVDNERKTLFVIDAKFLKTRHSFQGFRSDIGEFKAKKGYNVKLQAKIDWVSSHLSDVSKELSIDVVGYDVAGFFVVDSFVFYGLFSEYPIIPIRYLNEYLVTLDPLCYIRNSNIIN
jgi:hypothetical protein